MLLSGFIIISKMSFLPTFSLPVNVRPTITYTVIKHKTKTLIKKQVAGTLKTAELTLIKVANGRSNPITLLTKHAFNYCTDVISSTNIGLKNLL